MPSQRRMRVFGLLVALVMVIALYMTTSARQTRSSDFYTKTQEALQAREYEAAAKRRDAEDVGSRLKAAEEKAKKSADKKNQKYMDSVGGGSEKSVAGRVMLNEQDGDKKVVPGVASVGGRSRDKETAEAKEETAEEHEVETELNSILKKSPIIIFSKTFCPFSKKAKNILLEKYKINPAPFVVELDEHPLGRQLQATLAMHTGRKTVPNVLVMGKTIGGGDDIEELHRSDRLLDTLKSMGGSRIVEASRRERQEMRKFKA